MNIKLNGISRIEEAYVALMASTLRLIIGSLRNIFILVQDLLGV